MYAVMTNSDLSIDFDAAFNHGVINDATADAAVFQNPALQAQFLHLD